MNASSARAAQVALAVLALALPLDRAVAQETGEAWETTVQITMAGAQSFAMPAQTSTVCRPAGQWTEPPAPEGSQCTMSNVSHSGSTMSWTMECTEPRASGNGTMTFEGDSSYTGEMTVEAEQGTMKMKMSGRRTGTCDAGAQARQMKAYEAQTAQVQAQIAQQQADMCSQAAASGQSYLFLGPHATCKDPAQLAAFCAGLATEAGYTGAKANTLGVDLPAAATACNVDPEETHAELCVKALASESLDFLTKECPDQALVVAQRECAGRKYTQLAGSKYQGFCSTYWQQELQAQEQQAGQGEQTDEATAEAEAKKGAMGKMKKGLKGIFGK